jgi:cysteine-rich repeat protein
VPFVRPPIAIALALVLAPSALVGAVSVPGRGNGNAECWLGFEVDGLRPVTGPDAKGRVFQEACRDSCLFAVRLCVNRPFEQCTPAPLRDIRGADLLDRPADLSLTDACGLTTPIVLDVKRKKRLAKRTLRLRTRANGTPGRDVDRLTLICTRGVFDDCERCGDGRAAGSEQCDDANRVEGDGCDSNCRFSGCVNGVKDATEECDDGNAVDGDGCDSNCTETRCGNGIVTAGEECDPPSATCTSSCTTVPASSCTCGATDPTLLDLTTGDPGGACGQLTNSSGNPSLECGGLYFGAAGSAVAIPLRIAGGLTTTARVACSGTRLVLSPAPGGDPKNCIATGCRFGPPAPLVNPVDSFLSLCVANVLRQDGTGEADCTTGTASLALRIVSKVFQTGDTQPGKPGTQPCPVCVQGSCRGGPRDGAACEPYSDEIPESSDCLAEVAPVNVRFDVELSTTGATRTSASATFCGFCRDADVSNSYGICRGGLNEGGVCANSDNCANGGTCTDVQPCNDDTGCAQPRESCRQRNLGAFGTLGNASATIINATGSPAGDLRDGAAHRAILGGVWCIPPGLDDTADAVADLPGPAAISLPLDLRLH